MLIYFLACEKKSNLMRAKNKRWRGKLIIILSKLLSMWHPKREKNQFISQISLPFVNRCCVNILLRFILYQVPFNAQVAVFYFLLSPIHPARHPSIYFSSVYIEIESERNDYGETLVMEVEKVNGCGQERDTS